MAPDSVLPLLCLCCFLLPVSVACPEPFHCGYLGDIRFPFFDNTTSPSCGLLPIAGCDDDPMKPRTVKLGKESEWLPVEKILYKNDDEQQIISRDPKFGEKLRSNPCSVFLEEHPTLSSSLLNGISHLKCKHRLDQAFKYFCNDYYIYDHPDDDNEWPDPSKECSLIQLPSERQSPIYIQVHVPQSCIDCHYSRKGICLPDGKCSVHENQKMDPKSITIGVAIGSVGVIIIGFIVILLWKKRRYKSLGSQNQSRSIESDNTHSRSNQSNTNSNAILESRNIYFGVPLFSYEELQEATNKFDQSRELGSGGFGTVYYGKLKDGREVAVKRLFERNYKRVQQFINEVNILTRLRHRNLVSLYGCTSRASRELLLVYEYISNGTLGCHLHGNLAKPGSLPWPVRMRIAVETANALSYLHACGIIHRDVKSSNLLLDHHFCVKVADFGLSRLFPKFVSHVSTAPAGSPGYLDPEYHQCYQLTEKSDVYSFGVVLIEMISSKPAIDVTRHKDEIKLANLAVNKIQRGAFTELVDPSLGFESDNEVKKMIISVATLAFQCLQRDREQRPSMDEVMEFLQKIENGNHDLKHLEFPGTGFSNKEIHSALPISVHKDGAGSLNNSKPQRPPHTI